MIPLENILSSADDKQKLAIQHFTGPAVVFAGAGSGKTRVICQRVLFLMHQKVPSSQILIVTFTNKAAEELRQRIKNLTGIYSRNITICTFHSFSARYLRAYAQELGYTENFSIYDDSDQSAVMKEVYSTMGGEFKIAPAVLKHKIDEWKNRSILPDNLQEDEDSTVPLIQLKTAYQKYQDLLKKQNAMDFNDLILNMSALLKNHPHVRAQMQDRFKFFMIDEFQDTNASQFELIFELSSQTKNLLIVGDDDQSIYSWRGAMPSFMLNFSNFYKDSVRYLLGRNYRSSGIIVNAAATVIQNNFKRAPKTIRSVRDDGHLIEVMKCDDSSHESFRIVEKIQGLIADGVPLNDIAVLYRTNSQSRSLEESFRRQLIPYTIYGSVKFYERAEIKTLISYLRFLINPFDFQAFTRMSQFPKKGMGDKVLENVERVSLVENCSVLDALIKIEQGTVSHSIKGKGLAGVKHLVALYEKLTIALQEKGVLPELLQTILIHTNFEEFLKQAHPNDFDDRWLNVLELKNALERFARFADNSSLDSLSCLALFLEDVALVIDPVKVGDQEHALAVSLMTIHAAKGLEYKYVFVCGLEEGTLPHASNFYDPQALEEERRLLYVAMTRAKDRLWLSYVKTHRYQLGWPVIKSRFFAEIPQHFMQEEGPSLGSLSVKNEIRLMSADDLLKRRSGIAQPPAQCQFVVGQEVEHRVFGRGTILKIENSDVGFKLDVSFPHTGVKRLLDKFVEAPDLSQKEEMYEY